MLPGESLPFRECGSGGNFRPMLPSYPHPNNPLPNDQ